MIQFNLSLVNNIQNNNYGANKIKLLCENNLKGYVTVEEMC